MMKKEDIARYLPCYLSPESKTDLFKELKSFPNNIDSRMYTKKLVSEMCIFQGDGLSALPVIRLPDTKTVNKKVMVLSNTCDLALENKRPIPMRMCYAPLILFKKYEDMLKRMNRSDEFIRNHILDIKTQKVSHIFFLPSNDKIGEDCLVFLDTIVNHENLQSNDIKQKRLFTLSDY